MKGKKRWKVATWVEDERLREILEKEDKDVFRILTIDKDYQVSQVPVRTALGAGPIVNDAIDEDTRFVYIPGAITERILDRIAPAKLKQVTIVLPNPTKVFVSAVRWQQLKKMGLHVQVLESIRWRRLRSIRSRPTATALTATNC